MSLRATTAARHTFVGELWLFGSRFFDHVATRGIASILYVEGD